MKTLTLAAALLLAASSALAQTVIDSAVRAPSSELTPAPAEALSTPAMPAVPAGLATRVRALGEVVDQTTECFTFHGERDEHIADRRCPGWFAAIQRGGAAGAHAIGVSLDRDFDGGQFNYENAGYGAWLVRPRVMRLMTAQGGPVAATYLARYVARSAEVNGGLDSDSARAALEALATLAGEDLTRVAPWEDQSEVLRDRDRVTAVVQRWLRWHRDVSTLPRAEQTALALRHNVESLASTDVAQRWGAIQRLAAVPAQRAAVVSSLRELAADPSLPAEGRSLVARWARRQGLPLPARRAALAAN